MSVATVLPAKPVVASGGRRLTPANHSLAVDAVNSARPGDTIVLPPERIDESLRFLDVNDVTLETQAGTLLAGGGREGVYAYRCDRIRVTGPGRIEAADSNGIGIYSGSGHVIDGALKVARCGAMGILINTSNGTPMERIWIEGADISDCGRAGAFGGDEYWMFGCHCLYFGGGQGGYVSGVIIGNRLHDQHAGYGMQLGGQAQGVVVAGNLFDGIDGAAAGGPVSDRNARGIQVFSSYSRSRDVLIVSNVFRGCAGAPFGVGPNGNVDQGIARDNVVWASGPANYVWGTEHGLTDGGRNVVADLRDVAAALAAGKLDPAFVRGATPAPVPTPTPTPVPVPVPLPAVTVAQTIADGATLKGIVKWQATTSDDSRVASVDFLEDGAVKHVEISAPYGNGEPPDTDGGQYDTRKHLGDGPHKLSVKAHLADGTTVSSPVANATVENTIVTPPPPPPPPPADPCADVKRELATVTADYLSYKKMAQELNVTLAVAQATVEALTEGLASATTAMGLSRTDCRAALIELRVSAGYKAAKRDNPKPGSFAATHLGKCEAALQAAFVKLGGS